MTELALRASSAAWLRLRAIDRVWLAILLILAATAALAPARAPEVVEIAVAAFAGTLPFIAAAVGLVAYLRASGAEAIVARAFEGSPARMIVVAALVGGLAPFCSCEVIPFIAGLLALGAPVPAVMAFWLASPLMDPPSFMLTAGALGWEFALGKAVAAVGIGLMGGFALMGMMRAGAFANPLRPDAPVKRCGGCGAGPSNARPVWRIWESSERAATFRTEAAANALFLLKWLALAYLIQGLMVSFVPAETVGGLVGGDGPGAIALGALIGMPAYLNGYAAPPLVAALVSQGMSAGAAMAFLTAGAVSCIPAMAAVWSLVRLPVFAAYAAFGLGGAMLAGGLFSLVV
jgi:uncharacterized membrane protein YraQ (UPF0718 family)